MKTFLNRFQIIAHEYSFQVSYNNFEGTVSAKQFKENNIEALLRERKKERKKEPGSLYFLLVDFSV